MGNPRYQQDGKDGPGFGLTLHEDLLELPRHCRQPKRVFVNSMSDLFHPQVPPAYINRIFEVMESLPRHRFQILTKRPGHAACLAAGLHWPANVWMGTSIESGEVISRVRKLRKVPAAIRFLSCEPLLGPLTSLGLNGIDWVIVGGESDPNHRPVDSRWVRAIRDACVDAEVPFFFKQWGGRTPKARGRELDGRVLEEMPRA